LFGIVVATGGSQGVSCATHVRAAVQYCHGWTLPYQVGVQSKEFGSDGSIANEAILQRLRVTGRDLAAYGKLLADKFRVDLSKPAEHSETFAGWHARALT